MMNTFLRCARALAVKSTERSRIRIGRHSNVIRSKVAAVHPEVANGTMTVDVVLDYALPPGIDLEQAVDATIAVGELTNVVYVGRPVFGPSNSRVMLFKLEPDGHSAKKVPVQFGAASVNLIDIKSGLQPGDKVMVSDMSRYDRVAAI